MILLVIASCLGALMLCLVFLKQRARHSEIKASVIKCINLITALKNVLIVIQKHRGLTTAYLNGQHGLKPTIDDMKALADKLWLALLSEHSELIENALYLGVSNHWERLKDRWVNQSIDNNIEQHNRLILNLLFLIDSQSESKPLASYQRGRPGLAISLKALLETIEILGQIRAIGSGMMSARKSKALERNKLSFLISKAELNLSEITLSYEQASSIEYAGKEKKYLSMSAQNWTDLVAFITEHFAKEHIQERSSDEFFDLASCVIRPLSLLFDDVLDSLKQEVSMATPWHAQ
jgi:hypothetical protein